MSCQPTATEMAELRADAAAIVLDKDCAIERASTTKDAYGSSTPVYAPINATKAGLSMPTAGELQNYAYAIEDKAAWTVRLPYGTDVTAQDHLIIDGQTLEVHIHLSPQSYPVFTSVIAAEIKP